MKPRVVTSVSAFFALAGVVLALMLFGPVRLFSANIGGESGNTSLPTSDNVIVHENAHLGTTSWMVNNSKSSTKQIQAYADATYVFPGRSITFYVSTEQDGTRYWIDIYRMGWYQGSGGRLMAAIGAQVGRAQGYFDTVTHKLVGCRSCLVNAATGLVEANWQPSYILTVPLDWTTGIYLAKFTDANGFQTYAPFDVVGEMNSTYVVVTPDTTYAAYNNWGGYSLYENDNSGAISAASPSEGMDSSKAVKVSFDRPYVQEDGTSQVLVFEEDAIKWMERQGYDLSYVSDVYLQEIPGQLTLHRAYISIGHDEYWTKEMRDAVEYARSKGVGLAFLGADVAYWQLRFEPDSKGIANRTIVCYKVETPRGDLSRDPLYSKDNSRLTTLWRDPAVGRPENALIGIMFSDLTHQRPGYPWSVSSAAANSPLLKGTGLQVGMQYGCDLVGYEWDRAYSNGFAPQDLQIIGATNTINDTGQKDKSNTSYYVSTSGALVFATGSIYWTNALDNYRLHSNKTCSPTLYVAPGMQRLMSNVMSALIVHYPFGV